MPVAESTSLVWEGEERHQGEGRTGPQVCIHGLLPISHSPWHEGCCSRIGKNAALTLFWRQVG